MATSTLIMSVICVILIVTILATGVSLHKKAKPYSNAVLTVHKLATVAIIVLAVIIFIPYLKTIDLDTLVIIVLILSVISAIGLMASGGSMSLDKNNEIMLRVHNISTAIFLLSAATLVYILIL